MSSLVLYHVGKQYETGEFVIDDFDLAVDGREFVVFVGPSGCGKSTVLRMIAGLEEVTMGEILIDGKAVDKKMAADGDIAMVFQNYALYPHMTVFDNIAYSLKINKIPKKEIAFRVKQIAEKLDLMEVLDRRPKELSGGQKQRVAMGRALIRNPKIFLMDEPLSNLDAKLRTQMRKEISKLYNFSDSIFVYVTHDQTEAMTLGTKIVVINQGKIKQVANPYDLYYYPENLFVAGFIGLPKMNFWEADIVRKNSEFIFRIKDFGDLPMDQNQFEIVKNGGYIGKKIIMGVRPEDIMLGQIVEDEYEGLKAKCTIDEMDGAVTYLYMENGESDVTLRINKDETYIMNSIYSFDINKDKIHMFDIESGKRINTKKGNS